MMEMRQSLSFGQAQTCRSCGWCSASG